MLREHNKIIVQSHKFLDICLTAAAFIAAYFIKRLALPTPFRGLTILPNYYVVLLLIIIIWYLVFAGFDLYASYRRQTFGRIFWDMVKAVSTAMLILILCMYFFKLTDVSRILLGIFFMLNIGFLAMSKGVVYRVLGHYRKKGFNFRNVLIVGTKERAKDVITIIGDQLGAGFKVVGCLDVFPENVGKTVKNGCKVIDTIDRMEGILTEQVVDELIFAMPLKEIENVDKYIVLAEDMGVSTRIIPDWQLYYLMYKPGAATISFEEFLGIPTMALHTTPPNRGALLVKSAFDYTFAAVAMVLFLPLFIIIAAALKLSSRGPVFYRQERCCLQGRRFMVYKFRTMALDAETRQEELKALDESDGPVFKIKKDPRIIPVVGTLLRKTSLDELPQLINVLKGEMSLVGPRPPIPSEVKEYKIWQRRRLSMKPGLTCIWQISPHRNEVSFEDWMNMDLKYIDTWSLALDFKIIFSTVLVMLSGGGR
jgi:exopolysaccharide biosynthesis polyprenyl glycosylphosphotransferase